MPKHITMKADPATLDFTPYALATLSDGFCETGKTASENAHQLVRYFIYCRSIELGLKACVLNNNCTPEVKMILSTKIGHDLIKAKNLAEKTLKTTLFSEEQNEVLRVVNISYKKKGIEYFTVDMIAGAMKGFKELPNIDDLANTAKTLNVYIKNKKMFIDSNTTRTKGELESGGLINIY